MKGSFWAMLALPFLPGCFIPVPYAFPTVSFIPPVYVGDEDQALEHKDLHAYRVDIRQYFGCPDLPLPAQYFLSPITTLGDWSSPQGKVSADWGYIWNCIALIYDGRIHHTVQLRLYRPGYELVRIRSWQMPTRVAWKRAPDLLARENALDALLAAPELGNCAFQDEPDSKKSDGKEPPWGYSLLQPGSSSVPHKETLRFAASEYDRLAALASADSGLSEIRLRLAAKAKWLREHADK
jgi:hypothetical protein